MGKYRLYVDRLPQLSVRDVITVCPATRPGGVWRPPDCAARHHVVIIIPYRDRKQHLLMLLYHLHPLLQRQQLQYRIVVVEQVREHLAAQ